MRHFIFCALLVLLCASIQAQSPWVAEKGHAYAQAGFTGIGPYSKLFFDGGDTYTLAREVSDRTLQLYGEYGVADKTSVLAVVPLKMLATGDVTENLPPDFGEVIIEEASFSTLGNVQLAVRRNFINRGYVVSGQLTLELPTAGFDEGTGLRGGLDALTITPSVSIGAGTDHLYGFFYAGAGIRTNDYSSEFRLGGEAGYQVLKRIYVAVVLDVVQSFENGDAAAEPTQLQTGLYLNNQEFFAYGLKAIVGFTDRLGLTAAFYGAGSGNLVARSPSLNAGVYYKWFRE